MQVRLFVTNDKSNIKKVVLRSDTTIGRSTDCNLRIASQEVSRNHCRIVFTETSVFIRDLGSSNGTFLNGTQLQPNRDVPLPAESELEVGNVRFRVEHELPVEELDSTADVPNTELNRISNTYAEASATNAAAAVQTAPAALSPPTEPAEVEVPENEAQETIRDDVADETISETIPTALPVAVSQAEALNNALANIADEADDAEETNAFDFADGAMPDDDDEPQDPPTDIHKDSPLENLENEFPDPEETLSMDAGDFDFKAAPAKSRAAMSQSNTDEEQDIEESENTPADRSKKGLKSLFGFFGRKKDSATTGTEKTPTLAASARQSGFAEIPKEEQTIREDAPQPPEDDLDATLLEPDDVQPPAAFDPAPADEETPFAKIAKAEGETQGEGDEDLQDFFRQIGQD